MRITRPDTRGLSGIDRVPRRYGTASLDFVVYCSPFGSAQHLQRHIAQRRLDADLKVWNREQEAGGLTSRQLEHGPPRIEER